MSQRWRLTHELEEFTELTRDLLIGDPVGNTLALHLIESLKTGTTYSTEPPYYAWLGESRGDVLGAVLCTPPHPLVLAVVPPESVHQLADCLQEAGVTIPGISGELSIARAVANELAQNLSQQPRITEARRLYRWADPTPGSRPAAGTAHPAVGEDLDLVESWWTAFMSEAGTSGPLGLRGHLAERIDEGLITLWRDPAGVPVAMACRREPVAGSTRIGPVYTPPAHRGRGHGSAVTYAASIAGRADGALEVCLFTDLTNATSNGIYQQIGYRPVQDGATFTLESPGARAEHLQQRVRLALDGTARLPLPDVVNWDIFPFEGDLRVKTLVKPVLPEPDRAGAGGIGCTMCQPSQVEPDAGPRVLWSDGSWRIKALAPDGVLAFSLEPVEHLDLDALNARQAERFGTLIVTLSRVLGQLPGIGRVHVNRWGDGAEHLHVWFFGRPLGALQLRGSSLPDWADVLPAPTRAEWAADLDSVAAGLAVELSPPIGPEAIDAAR